MSGVKGERCLQDIAKSSKGEVQAAVMHRGGSLCTPGSPHLQRRHMQQ